MWHLDHPSKGLKEWYKSKILSDLMKRIWNSKDLSQGDKNILMPRGANDSAVLEILLLEDPQTIFAKNNDIMSHIITGYSDTELDDYAKACHTPISCRDPMQIALVGKYRNKLNALLKMFDYKGELSANKSRSYYLTGSIGHNTCVYCNRQYTFNVIRGTGTNNKERLARPALDHWFPESIYPLLSLSLYNLIPSCTVCNSSAKGDTIFRLTTHVNPYTTLTNTPSWTFDFKKGVSNNWEVVLDGLTDPKEKATAEVLFLQEAYQCHANLEVKDLLTIALQNGGSYIPTLINNVIAQVGLLSKEEAYRILLGTEMLPDNYDERPLSKLKRDILDHLGIVI